jgi:DNA-binding transcriptional regulator LsrR (DeoR family)
MFRDDNTNPHGRIGQERVELMAEVARLYYVEGLTQSQIGERFQISKATISRMLEEARRTKLVEVVIHYPISTDDRLEAALVEKFGLHEAHVLVSAHRPYTNLIKSVGKLAARTLLSYLKDGMTLGISWGMAVSATVDALNVTRPMHLRVIQTQGSSENDMIEGTNVVRTLAALFGNDFRIVPSPLTLKTAEIAQVLKQEASVCEALKIAVNADIALVGIGSVDPKVSGLVRGGYLSRQSLLELAAQGATGDICGILFGADGEVLDVDYNHRTVAIDIRKLREIPTVIGVSAGFEKGMGILSALRGRYINILVTDTQAAQFLIEHGS